MMIQEFVDRFMAAKDEIMDDMRQSNPQSYDDLVRIAVRAVVDTDSYDHPDVDRMHIIDDGHYQGTRLFIIPSDRYQPSKYWIIFVSYGNCSGCDTFQANHGYRDNDEPIPQKELDGNWTMMLHMMQSMKEIG